MNLMLIKVFNFDISVFTWGSAVITNWLRSEIFIGSIFCVCTTFDEDADWSVPSLGNLQRDYQGKEVSDIMYRWSTYTALFKQCVLIRIISLACQMHPFLLQSQSRRKHVWQMCHSDITSLTKETEAIMRTVHRIWMCVNMVEGNVSYPQLS